MYSLNDAANIVLCLFMTDIGTSFLSKSSSICCLLASKLVVHETCKSDNKKNKALILLATDKQLLNVSVRLLLQNPLVK